MGLETMIKYYQGILNVLSEDVGETAQPEDRSNSGPGTKPAENLPVLPSEESRGGTEKTDEEQSVGELRSETDIFRNSGLVPPSIDDPVMSQLKLTIDCSEKVRLLKNTSFLGL